MRNENYALENYRDQIKQLEKELEISNKNKEMFYRLWAKWATETLDIQMAIERVQRNIEEIKRHPQ